MIRRLFESIGRRPRTGGAGATSQDERAANGESFEEAIIIHAQSSVDGVPKEYEWIERRFGRHNRDWKRMRQALMEHGNRWYGVIRIRLADGSIKEIHFDITDFFGKMPS
jgi:hypothetical protein